nr:hypothetical protein [Tanacetum cinerariifolium]
LIATIEALNDNPTPSFDCKTKSSSTSLNSLLEETNIFHNSFSEFENFYFDLGEISSGNTTTHSDISLSEYDSFIFDFAHIISPSEYDRFYFWNLPDPGELMSVINSRIRKNLLSTTSVNVPIEDDHSPLMAYVVWIFLAYLTYPVIPPYLYLFGNEDTIFDPGITINHFYFKLGLSHRHGAFKKFNTQRKTLQGAPVSTDTELGGYVREFESRVRQNMDEIYTRFDDEQTERQLLAGRLNMLFRDRRAHAHTRLLMEA